MHAMMSILKHVMDFFAHLEDGSMIGLRMCKTFKDISIAPQINVITEMAILCNIHGISNFMQEILQFRDPLNSSQIIWPN